MDKYKDIKDKAGVKDLNQYANDYELQTLCQLLSADFEKILETDDVFCTKIFISNIKKINFDILVQEMISKRK